MNKIKKTSVTGSRRLSNYFWTGITLIGGAGFLLAGLSSYKNQNILSFIDCKELIFIPQGILMIFYGTIATFISYYLFLTLIWDVGSGYNEFNLENQTITIMRHGFPGKNRIITLKYDIKEIKSIKVLINDGLNPKRQIYLFTKTNNYVPLINVGAPLELSKLEDEALALSKFLNLGIEEL